MIPSTTLAPRDNLDNIFSFEGRKISPVEMATFHTVDFSKSKFCDVILCSTTLTACAVLLIKNKSKTTGKYDNVVTMAHFHHTNAMESVNTAENVGKAFEDFTAHGGEFNKDTSVILLGGGVLPGEEWNTTTPLGPLRDCLVGNQET